MAHDWYTVKNKKQAQITQLMTSQKQLQNIVMSQQAVITELKKQ